MPALKLNGDRLIRVPREDSKVNYLAAFWKWVELLAAEDFHGALESLYWPKEETHGWTPDGLKERITTFWGGDAPWSVVVPNDRLVSVINEDARFEFPTKRDWRRFLRVGPRRRDFGWLLAQVPVTTHPASPKDDTIPLMGVASSFFVRPFGGHYVMEHEIFHL